MQSRLHWTVSIEWLLQFENINKLRLLNSIVGRDRVAAHYPNDDDYKAFIERFYYDDNFNRQYSIWKQTKNTFDKPSLDHIIPLSRGGGWELDNLQIISWFENNAKSNMTPEEFKKICKRYL